MVSSSQDENFEIKGKTKLLNELDAKDDVMTAKNIFHLTRTMIVL
jgi:hypothetical protein